MTTFLQHTFLGIFSRLIVGYVFVSYGIEKIFTPKDFAHSIMNYEMMPHSWVNIAALIMPWVEVFAGAMLILGLRLRAASFISSMMLVMFIMAIGVAMGRGLEINCGCSAHPEPVGFPKILEDLGFLVLSLLVYLFPNSTLTLDAYIQRQRAIPEPTQTEEAVRPA